MFCVSFQLNVVSEFEASVLVADVKKRLINITVGGGGYFGGG